MTHVTCRLTAKNRDQLRNPTLGNRVWATFTFNNKVKYLVIYLSYVFGLSCEAERETREAYCFVYFVYSLEKFASRPTILWSSRP